MQLKWHVHWVRCLLRVRLCTETGRIHGRDLRRTGVDEVGGGPSPCLVYDVYVCASWVGETGVSMFGSCESRLDRLLLTII